jgi:hypothetical protein
MDEWSELDEKNKHVEMTEESVGITNRVRGDEDESIRGAHKAEMKSSVLEESSSKEG